MLQVSWSVLPSVLGIVWCTFNLTVLNSEKTTVGLILWHRGVQFMFGAIKPSLGQPLWLNYYIQSTVGSIFKKKNPSGLSSIKAFKSHVLFSALNAALHIDVGLTSVGSRQQVGSVDPELQLTSYLQDVSRSDFGKINSFPFGSFCWGWNGSKIFQMLQPPWHMLIANRTSVSPINLINLGEIMLREPGLQTEDRLVASQIKILYNNVIATIQCFYLVVFKGSNVSVLYSEKFHLWAVKW